MQLSKTLKNKISKDLNNIQTIIISNLFSNISFINFGCSFFENKKSGKLLRPLILVLLVRALGYTGQQHIWFAAIVELIHLATLVHDDVVDRANIRRDKKTFNNYFGNTKAVLFGDFIYSKAFQMMTMSKNLKILQILSNATNKIAEGEIFQLQNIRNVHLTPEDYMFIIEKKTSTLFEAAALIAIELVKNTTKLQEKRIQIYGKFIGLIYQLIDDILDYNKSRYFTGKFIKKDLFEHKITLPLILAFSINMKFKKKAELIFTNNNKENEYLSLFEFVQNSNVFTFVDKLVNYLIFEAQKSIDILPNNVYKYELIELPKMLFDLTIKRNSETDEI